jgi:hypothetical protein
MRTRFDTLSSSTLPVRVISSGPNTGWAFFHSPVKSLGLVVNVSDAWKSGSSWRNLQKGGTYTDAMGNKYPYCTNSQIPAMMGPSLQHEGYLPGLYPSHVDLFRDWFKNNSPQDSIEAARLYMPDYPGMDAASWLANYDIAHVMNSAMADPAQQDTASTGKVALAPWVCKPRF